VAAGLPVVALVGRPNVGKSTLFNRILGSRRAIVEDRARTTRDRLYGNADWNGRRFVVVDTGGLEIDPNDPIEERVQDQARLAINEADVIVLVVDAATGPTPADLEAAALLRRAKSPILVAVNKADNEKRDLEAAEFHVLGWEEMFAISAAHGRGTGDLLDAIVWALPPETPEEIARKAREIEAQQWERDVAAGFILPDITKGPALGDDEDLEDDEDADRTPDPEAARWDAAMAADSDEPVAIAIVGRPNVGKSSLVNALLGEERVIVSDIPGTTRDAIDTVVAYGRSEVVLIDTAGIRRRGKVANGPAAERYAALRSMKAISRADVAIVVIDAQDGLTAQDAQGPGHRGQQVGPPHREDRQDVRPVRDRPAPRGAVHRPRAGDLDQCQDRPARRPGPRGGRRHLGRAPSADRHGRAQPARGRGDPAPVAVARQGPPAEDLLCDPGRRRAADVRLLRQGRRLRPFQLPALPREPDP
jgi:ribosome-associated GTPase EngA